MAPPLLFIRHAAPQIIDAEPPHHWNLSEAGRVVCIPLSERVRVWQPTRIITSREPKAAQTGAIIADALHIPVSVFDGLHEHVRSAVTWHGAAHRDAQLQAFFANPDALIFGDETANAALARFKAAIDSLLALYPDDTLAIATHGTVLTLYLAARLAIDPFPFWKQIGLPDLFVLSRDENRLL